MLVVFIMITAFVSCSAQVQCPDNTYQIYNGQCYHLGSYFGNWSTAQDICASYGLSVMSFRSMADISAFVNSDTSILWVGATDIANEGQFVWDDTREPITVDFQNIVDMTTNTDSNDCLVARYMNTPPNRVYATDCGTTSAASYCMGPLNSEETTTPQDTTSTTRRTKKPCKKG
ncbi:lectin BRA-3-like [Physella acuta]|uniref:lectin BRA-3-like n=1 Tax=Physella acuta TaxID=109671 RepID=UPI0027DE4AF4|nr:lectin BRA-3-like [Physella acuta]